MTYRERYETYRTQIEQFLEDNLSDSRCEGQEAMAEAMRYSALAGGKRIRPVLVMEFCRISGGDPLDALPFGAALEMIHTYSLIHDDLPCMDDDDYRRGRLTSHKVFGEAVAVLAGDALLTRAFEVCSAPELLQKTSPEHILKAVQTLSANAGVMGMIGGQMLDMDAETNPPDLDGLIRLQRLKTGALIRAAARIGCLIGGATEKQLAAADEYASSIGLAFQIRDDMLDVEGDPNLLGKATGADQAHGKATFPALTGMDACRAKIEELTNRAVVALSAFSDPHFLRTLAEELAQRNT